MKTIQELKQIARNLRESGEWEDFLDIGKDTPCHKLKKYFPGDVVKSFGGGIIQKGKYVYIGSFRSQGVYGLYLLLNEKGKVVKHDNIAFEDELTEQGFRKNASVNTCWR